ncbi:hypothetical protein JOL62DRAFT_3143 [Phyllosticta paracitricarpa]|uniref:Uncharacterized protein n=1 Tax=Phyllosticta paracitricarpa TaxID=2016321 RepID=A0ABR1NLE6_9PEZI
MMTFCPLPFFLLVLRFHCSFLSLACSLPCHRLSELAVRYLSTYPATHLAALNRRRGGRRGEGEGRASAIMQYNIRHSVRCGTTCYGLFNHGLPFCSRVWILGNFFLFYFIFFWLLLLLLLLMW